ncbi:histidine kinase N-terminal domain-containing protein [Lipingzhangella sp. LS1_29]|uniref:histidine kinase n=1 Tax=Lipingzhangella rawalii TaxID=2055835 RepID=A0ABU2HB28_9ACTN|nr:histidine kinase N-terminal domain-containing protein [Lipingzhangella rawalii]MDS1272064.1 histidine kinase N-terminal domain-containing protein [Lipingzhangella rawalii]
MPHLSDLIRRYTALRTADLEWLHALVSDWQLLADLSFADLVLWVRLRDDSGWVGVAQMRPTTGPTAYHDDLVETVLRSPAATDSSSPAPDATSSGGSAADSGPSARHALLDRAWFGGRICREGDPDWTGGVPVREEMIPVRRSGALIAVIQRSTNLSSARTPSRLELTYLQSASDLAQMIAEGEFPFSDQGPLMVRSPRVGDGLLRLDQDGRVVYASPNALSAYRRLGLTADLVGTELVRTTLALASASDARDESLSWTVSGRVPREAEVEARGSVVQLRSIPLVIGGRRVGALVMVRDVTELRRRERELMTKDATIREIHHRVKNNLQTVAALLRLQSRRMEGEEGREALDEAVRRVGSIAIVHETLSHTPDEVVDFDDVADRVIQMAAEVSVTETPVQPRREGEFGMLPAIVATPLSMVLAELVQNAVEHGLNQGQGRIRVRARRVDPQPGKDQDTEGRLLLEVSDDGGGVPADFDAGSTSSLGLQIVRTLIVGELGGELEFTRPSEGGTSVRMEVPILRQAPTTE